MRINYFNIVTLAQLIVRKRHFNNNCSFIYTVTYMRRPDLTHSLTPHIHDACSKKIDWQHHICGSVVMQLNNI